MGHPIVRGDEVGGVLGLCYTFSLGHSEGNILTDAKCCCCFSRLYPPPLCPWPMNSEKSRGNHRRLRGQRKSLAGGTGIQVNCCVVSVPPPPRGMGVTVIW